MCGTEELEAGRRRQLPKTTRPVPEASTLIPSPGFLGTNSKIPGPREDAQGAQTGICGARPEDQRFSLTQNNINAEVSRKTLTRAKV